MTEWLGKSRIEKEDLDRIFPSLNKYFPMLGKFYTENQRMRIVLPMDYELADKFKSAVIKKYGEISPGNIKKAAFDAISEWISNV